MKIEELAEKLFVFTDETSDFLDHATVLLTADGPVIVDVFRTKTQFEYVKRFIKEKGFETPNSIIYTHWHTDHTCGNLDFKECTVVSSEATRKHLLNFIDFDLERLKKMGILDKGAKPIIPSRIFTGKLEMEIGKRKLSLIHCPGHSYDSILVYDIHTKTLIAGDNIIGENIEMFLPPLIPPDTLDAKPEHLTHAYEVIKSFDMNLLIPGHGDIKAPAEMLKENRHRYMKLLEKGF